MDDVLRVVEVVSGSSAEFSNSILTYFNFGSNIVEVFRYKRVLSNVTPK